jgi:hypothetical protein
LSAARSPFSISPIAYQMPASWKNAIGLARPLLGDDALRLRRPLEQFEGRAPDAIADKRRIGLDHQGGDTRVGLLRIEPQISLPRLDGAFELVGRALLELADLAVEIVARGGGVVLGPRQGHERALVLRVCLDRPFGALDLLLRRPRVDLPAAVPRERVEQTALDVAAHAEEDQPASEQDGEDQVDNLDEALASSF